MPYLIGVDEAGYGPNLGPLVVAATLWRVPAVDVDLRQRFVSLVSPKPPAPGLIIGDSKQIHQANQSLALLEHHTLSALSAADPSRSTDFGWLWEREFATPAPNLKHQTQLHFEPLQPIEQAGKTSPWNERFYFDCQRIVLPQAAGLAAIHNLATSWHQLLQSTQIDLIDVQFSLQFPETFNRSCEQLHSKGAVLTHTTLQLVKHLAAKIPGGEAIRVFCDKHGGRDDYRSWLHQVFQPLDLMTLVQSEAISLYRWSESGRSWEVSFCTSGESQIPTALASMTAKYVREVAMNAWNSFWQQYLPDLRPTKGYPVDAKRFSAEIQTVQQELGISDNLIWRVK